MHQEIGLVVVTGDDMRVERAMAVATLQCAAGVGRALQPVVNHAARLVGGALRIQPKVPGRGRAVVNAAVAQVNRKAGCGKLRLRETLARQPRQSSRGRSGELPVILPATIWSWRSSSFSGSKYGWMEITSGCAAKSFSRSAGNATTTLR